MNQKFTVFLYRPKLERHRHVVCRICTDQGKIEEANFTKAKHGKLTYKICKKSNWGDQLPMRILDAEEGSSDDSDDEIREK